MNQKQTTKIKDRKSTRVTKQNNTAILSTASRENLNPT
jgi:hypothetical protein